MLSINRTDHILIKLLLLLISQPLIDIPKENCNHDPNPQSYFNTFYLKVKPLVDRHFTHCTTHQKTAQNTVEAKSHGKVRS